MSRCVKNLRRGEPDNARIMVKGAGGSTGVTGPYKFDARSNLRGPEPKSVVNRDAGSGGKAMQATRVPN